MSGWHHLDMPVYDPAWTHPGWLTACPTPTMDVYFFTVEPTPEWQAFGFGYANETFRLRYRRLDAVVQVAVYAPPVEELTDESWPDYYLSLWVGGKEQVGADGPTETFDYRIDAPFVAELQTTRGSEPVVIGFFTGERE